MSGKAHGLPARIGHTIVSMKQSALFLANVCLGSEIFETSFDVAYVVDGDTEVADAKFCRAIPRLEYRDVVKAVGERDVAGIRAAERAHAFPRLFLPSGLESGEYGAEKNSHRHAQPGSS